MYRIILQIKKDKTINKHIICVFLLSPLHVRDETKVTYSHFSPSSSHLNLLYLNVTFTLSSAKRVPQMETNNPINNLLVACNFGMKCMGERFKSE